MKHVILALIAVIFVGIGIWFITKPRVEKLGPPEIAGWIAWWKEEPGYDLAASRSGGIKSVSPVWWLVDENWQLKNVGKVDRKSKIDQMQNANVTIYPTIGSELYGKQLSGFFKDPNKMDQLIVSLMKEIDGLKIQGIDVDLEGILENDRGAYISMVTKLKQQLVSRNLKLSVTIGAADNWAAPLGEVADEVRIMAYDYHYVTSKPGAIAPIDWITEVAKNNMKLFPKEKLVMGIPSYGYIWLANGKGEGLQWDEIQTYLVGKKYTSEREAGSGEIKITGEGFVGWVNDGQSMREKIEVYRKMGLNKFVIWHVGGMDVPGFEQIWKPDSPSGE